MFSCVTGYVLYVLNTDINNFIPSIELHVVNLHMLQPGLFGLQDIQPGDIYLLLRFVCLCGLYYRIQIIQANDGVKMHE